MQVMQHEWDLCKINKKKNSVKTKTTTFRDTYEQIRKIILKWVSKRV